LKSLRHLFPFKSYFPLPVSTSGFGGRHLRLRCRAVLALGSVISKSGVVENVEVAVEIASPSVSVQKLFPLPVSTSGFVADICVPVSVDVGP